MSETKTPTDPIPTPITIEEEMRRSYLDYAMSVIVSRALPDVRDGLKPVHRRILYAMQEAGYTHDKPFRKSARIVGDVMGKYHPHGDAAIYDAMVRMAQDFSMRLPLIDGQGNFGSMDGDPPAAMRYTEARLAKPAHALLADIGKETVGFQENYDGSIHEPVVLPAELPNLLINGASGIAVGMATNIPPHNTGEVIDACCAYIDNPDISLEELMVIVPGPDFPTGGVIMGKGGIREAFFTGRGSVIMRGKVSIEDLPKDRQAIIIHEVPYQVNKARLIERIAECVNEKIIDGISDLRDESDRDGVRVVIEIKKGAMTDVVLNQIYRYTPLQTSFGVIMLALRQGRPELMNLKEMIAAFIEFREEVITRRTAYDLARARERAHILIGLAIAVANIDEMIALIRKAKDPASAREKIMEKSWPAKAIIPLVKLVDEPGEVLDKNSDYKLSEEQAKAILDLRLHRLTGLEREKIESELREVSTSITEHLSILSSRKKLLKIMTSELLALKKSFADPRRTTIEEGGADVGVPDEESLIQREEMVVTVSHNGYIKRVPLVTYRAQRRGGKGRAGMATREEDFVSQVFVASTHTPILFFSSRGTVYRLKTYKLPLSTPQARGKPLLNLLPLSEGETISTMMPMPEDEKTWDSMDVLFATASGYVRRNRLSDFANIMAKGKIAMKLEAGDRLIGVKTCNDADDVLLTAHGGKCIRFPITAVRVFSGRNSIGVRGITLGKKDEVISMTLLRHTEPTTEERSAYLRHASAKRRAEGQSSEGEENGAEESSHITLLPKRLDEMESKEEFLLCVSEKGYGKRSSAYEYRVTGRGGSGIANMEMTEKNGMGVVATFPVSENDQIMLVTDGGKLIRCPVSDIRIAGRKTQGVTIFKIADNEKVVSVAPLYEGGEGTDNGK